MGARDRSAPPTSSTRATRAGTRCSSPRLDAVLDELTKDGRRLAERTWGERNTVRRPAPALPRGAAARGLAGHAAGAPPGRQPHAAGPVALDAGASERLAVSPGREDEGYFHMPGGQSGHPLSPHYRDGHAAWARGETTPFLPGPAVHVLTLVPAS